MGDENNRMKDYHYNKKLKPFARELRNNSTKAEICLWSELLRAKKLLGYPFLRQRPIDKYIADFLCKDLKLIIEVDGSSHNMKHDYDEQRDKTLKELGYTTLRFTNEEVLYDIENVKLALENWIKNRS